MLNFAGQPGRLAPSLGRLVSGSSTFSSSVSASASPFIPIQGPHAQASSRVRGLWFSCSRYFHCTQRPMISRVEASTSLLNFCRVSCLSLDHCVSQSCHQRFLGTSSPCNALTKRSTLLPEEKPGIMTRMLDSVGISGNFRFNRFKMRVAGLNMYQACADGYDFETFFRACNMPDTLFSWFLIMELHVWMCMVRLKQEGREGKYMTHYLILSMWHDIQARGKLMGIPSVKMKESLSKMVEQFNGALFAYDEGLLSNDKVLAAALWRNLFLRNCDDPERLANMVEYVRQQVQYLDSLDSSKLLQVGRIKWQPYTGGIPDSDEPLPKAASIEDELNIPEVDKVPVS
ncbi:ubiquinol-cytochrome-c reductase complex assembly factor 1-like [Lytechinus pictus]|uniref:ubiquinol-cytochrome-c reductase complex assembly factor 1-like n=1 Tax=Lytechinus pictus TaxID=7653 RepID=UPI0030B9F641